MATESTVNRTDDASGDDFATFTKGSGARSQGVNLDLEVGATQLTWVTTNATAVEAVLVDAAATGVFKVDVVLDAAVVADRWLLVFDKSSAAPVNTDVPILRARISGGFASIDLGNFGYALTNGLGVAISTTPEDLTLPGSGGEGYFQVGYI